MKRTKDHTALSEREFRRACSRFPTGVTIVTAPEPDGRPYGMTVSSFTSVSLRPPLILVCLDRGARLLRSVAPGCLIGVNVLKEGQAELCRRFSRPGLDRFRGVAWYSGQTGVPLLRDALAMFECRVTESISAGDHCILIGRVLRVSCREGRPLVYFRGTPIFSYPNYKNL